MLRLHLVGFPPFRRRHKHAPHDGHGFPRVDRRGTLAVGRHRRLQDRGEVGSSLSSSHDGERVTPQQREQLEGGHDLANPAVLARAGRVIPVQHVVGGYPIAVERPPGEERPGVIAGDPVVNDVSVCVEPHTVHLAGVDVPGRIADLVGFDQLHVELHAREPPVRGEHAENLAVSKLRDLRDAKLAGEVDVDRPIVERELDLAGGRRVNVRP